jgi:hypothetical protein
MGICASKLTITPAPSRESTPGADLGDSSSSLEGRETLPRAQTRLHRSDAQSVATTTSRTVARTKTPSSPMGGLSAEHVLDHGRPALALPDDETIAQLIDDAVFSSSSEADWTILQSMARSAAPGGSGKHKLYKQTVSSKRVRMLGFAELTEDAPGIAKRSARVWLQASRFTDLDVALSHAMRAKQRGGAMHKVPSFTLGKDGVARAVNTEGGPGTRNETAERIASAVRVYRVSCLDPSSGDSEHLLLSTGPGISGRGGRTLHVQTLRGMVPPQLLLPGAESALLRHLLEERIAHDADQGGALSICPVAARAIGLAASSPSAPGGTSEEEVVVEARLTGEGVTLWQVFERPKGRPGVLAIGEVLTPRSASKTAVSQVLPFSRAASQVHLGEQVHEGRIGPVLMCIASHTAAVHEGDVTRLQFVPLHDAMEPPGTARNGRSSTSDGVDVILSAGLDPYHDARAVAEMDVASVILNAESSETPAVVDDTVSVGTVLSFSKRQPIVPVPAADVASRMMGLDGAPRSTPFEPRSESSLAPGARLVKFVMRRVQGREGSAKLFRINAVDPAVGDERSVFCSVGAEDGWSKHGIVPLDPLVPARVLASLDEQDLLVHVLEERVVYSELLQRWWGREAVLWGDPIALETQLTQIASGRTTPEAASSVVNVVKGTPLSVVRQAIQALTPPASDSSSAMSPLSFGPCCARGVGCTERGESKLFVLEARLSGEAVTIRMVNPPPGAYGALLDSETRSKALNLESRRMVGRLKHPPAPLVLSLDTLLSECKVFIDHGRVAQALLKCVSRVSLEREDGGDLGSELGEGKWRLQLPSEPSNL